MKKRKSLAKAKPGLQYTTCPVCKHKTVHVFRDRIAKHKAHMFDLKDCPGSGRIAGRRYA